MSNGERRGAELEHKERDRQLKESIEKIDSKLDELTEHAFKSTGAFDTRPRLIEQNQGRAKDDLTEIVKQTTLTNSRIKKLELWRMFLIGAWAIVSMLIPYFLYQQSRSLEQFSDTVDLKIQSAVDKAIDANNDKFFEVQK